MGLDDGRLVHAAVGALVGFLFAGTLGFATSLLLGVSRSLRAADLARPFSRSHLPAASKSPPFSCSAFLASIIPAPVESRSSFTMLAVIVMSDS